MPDVPCYRYKPENSASRRTTASRCAIVFSCRNRLLLLQRLAVSIAAFTADGKSTRGLYVH